MNKVLVDQLRSDYPELRFREGKKFLFRPPKTIVLSESDESFDLLLLHEVGHFLCGHVSFRTEPERLKCEREAWERARELCTVYGVEYDETVAEGELDSYRNWLDKKSRCPVCGLTRFQTPDGVFHCPKCDL